MLAKEVCQKILQNTLSIHLKRIKALFEISWSLTKNAQLTLTSLGRHKEGTAYVKHKIKSVDRFLANPKIQEEKAIVYKELFNSLLNILPTLYILVDWSGCCGKDPQMIRASIVHEGRSITIYNQIYPVKVLGNHQIHLRFLADLKKMIPAGKKVVLVSDAGFGTPWFSAVKKMGWDFVGRINKGYTVKFTENWIKVPDLMKKATTRIKHVGHGLISKKNLPGHVYTVKQISKNRKEKTRFPKHNARYSRVHTDPWVLVSSLPIEKYKPKQIKNIYKKRMQIEQNFRDDKSIRFGYGWRASRTKSINRVEILCLIATVASLFLHWIGTLAEKAGLHRRFQVNSYKNKRILSFPFLAKQILLHNAMHITKSMWLSFTKSLILEYKNIEQGA